jgi:hypothetical protein
LRGIGVDFVHEASTGYREVRPSGRQQPHIFITDGASAFPAACHGVEAPKEKATQA